jgi:N-acetylglucosaminyl-diphospho-decaprenol L-rhamnosyltransferase
MHFAQGVNFSISVVSHGHADFIESLLKDIQHLQREDLEVIITWNLASEFVSFEEKFPGLQIKEIRNLLPAGFGQNHNKAFARSNGKNFVVLNPDVSLHRDPFTAILSFLQECNNCICAPIIIGPDSKIEDSARHFPSPLSLAKKLLAKVLRRQHSAEKIPDLGSTLAPDWIAGMFMVMPRQIFQKMNGFNEKYHLYYEDVDLCARARLSGIEIHVIKDAVAMHHAQRSSHREFRFLKWHLQSALRFFLSKAYFAHTFEKAKSQLSRNR